MPGPNAFDNWQGGTATTTQVATQTVSATWAAADTISTILTDENGTTTTLLTTIVGSTIENVVDEHLADLQASTNRLFVAITWAKVGTTQITATAKDSGVPFYLTVAHVTAGTGDYVTAATTANVGPNDLGTAANMVSGAVPVSDDEVRVQQHTTTGLSWPILYGLDQNAVNLQALSIPASFRGNVGDSINGFYLKLDVSNVSSGTARTWIRSTGGDVWLWGVHDLMYISATSRSTNAVRLKGTVTTCYIQESGVQGTITFADSMTLTTLEMTECPGAKVIVGTSVTTTTVNIVQGNLILKNAPTTVNQYGGTVETRGTGTITTYNQYGGTCYQNRGGVITTVNIRGGIMDTRDTKGTITSGLVLNIVNTNIYGGRLIDRGGSRSTKYDNAPTVHGGTFDSDYGLAVTPGT